MVDWFSALKASAKKIQVLKMSIAWVIKDQNAVMARVPSLTLTTDRAVPIHLKASGTKPQRLKRKLKHSIVAKAFTADFFSQASSSIRKI